MFSSYRKLSGSGTNSVGENNIGKWARPNQCIQLFLNIWKARFTQEVESLLIPIVFDYFCKKLNSFIPSPLVTGRLLLGECISYNGTRPVACFRTASRYRKREIRAQNVSSCFVSQVSSSHRFLVAGSLAKKPVTKERHLKLVIIVASSAAKTLTLILYVYCHHRIRFVIKIFINKVFNFPTAL